MLRPRQEGSERRQKWETRKSKTLETGEVKKKKKYEDFKEGEDGTMKGIEWSQGGKKPSEKGTLRLTVRFQSTAKRT